MRSLDKSDFPANLTGGAPVGCGSDRCAIEANGSCVAQDCSRASVFDVVASWANAPSNTASADLPSECVSDGCTAAQTLAWFNGMEFGRKVQLAESGCVLVPIEKLQRLEQLVAEMFTPRQLSFVPVTQELLEDAGGPVPPGFFREG